MSPEIPTEADPAVYSVINPAGQGPVSLVCEHASHVIPAALDHLGLTEADRLSHAVWDIGARDLAERLSATFDAPLLVAGLSRLVFDLNRPAEAPDAMPAQVERIAVPGNADLSEADRAARVAAVCEPFRDGLASFLEAQGGRPLVTIHTFTPVYYGERRETEIGLLHDSDPSMAHAMLAAAQGGFRVELNKPYSAADGVTHTLRAHAIPRGIANVMIEVRSDLIADAAGLEAVADQLAGMIGAVLDPVADAEAAP